MNNPGEIAPLARLARPHVAAVTTIGEAHIGHLGGLARHRRGEGQHRRAACCPAAPRCCRATMPISRGCATMARRRRRRPHPDLRPRCRRRHPAAGGRHHAAMAGPGRPYAVLGTRVEVRMPALGLHHAENACCALAVVAALGLDAAPCARRRWPAMRLAPAVARRGTSRSPGGIALLVDESYNAAPPAMRAALETLAQRARRAAHRGAGRHARARRVLRGAACRPGAGGGRGPTWSSAAGRRWRGCTPCCRRRSAVPMRRIAPPLAPLVAGRAARRAIRFW